MSLKLHVFPLSPRAFKVLWCANHLGLDYQIAPVDFAKGTNKTPAYLALNPNARMPVLEEDGFALWESNAIVNYLAVKKPEVGLLPAEPHARAQIEQWQFWDSCHWDQAGAIFVYERVVKPLFGLGEASPAELERGEKMFQRIGPVLDGQLQKHRYVAGDKLTVADFSIGAGLSAYELARFPLEPYRGIQRWHAELKAMPSWVRTKEFQARKAA